VRAELYVSSTARDTDFIVRVTDVYPDGRSILLMDYVRRARYREGYEKEVLMESGKVYKVAFDVGWTSQVFNRGHRIRITVASTGAPFYEPNPNTGEALTIEPPKKPVVAKNTVHHDRTHASRVIAPLCAPGLTGKERGELEQDLKDLNAHLRKLRSDPKRKADALADANVTVSLSSSVTIRITPSRVPSDESDRNEVSGIDRANELLAAPGGQPHVRDL
jgi:hypothetical protein